MTDKFVTLPEIRKHAKKVLARDAWNFGDGGAETETTLRRNHRAINRLAIRQDRFEWPSFTVVCQSCIPVV